MPFLGLRTLYSFPPQGNLSGLGPGETGLAAPDSKHPLARVPGKASISLFFMSASPLNTVSHTLK
jgi:hypothetical protein